MIHRFDFQAMGGPAALLVDSESTADALADRVEAEVARIESKFSKFDPNSVISALAKAIGPTAVDAETAELIDFAFRAWRLSDGLFDITMEPLIALWRTLDKEPNEEEILASLAKIGLNRVTWNGSHLTFQQPEMRLDLGGLAKEYAVDRCIELCREARACSLVNLAGDIAVTGLLRDGSPWQIGIADPRNPDIAISTIEINQGAVATSGDYQRGGHIIHPQTGRPMNAYPSITVAGKTCLLAGTLSTIALLRGVEGESWLATLECSYGIVQPSGELSGPLFA